MTIKFVSTMAQKEVESTLGKEFLESWAEYSKKSKLLIFVDDPSKVKEKYKNVEFLPFTNPKYFEFINKYKDVPEHRGQYQGRYEYRLDVVRFCHKIFAVGEAVNHLNKSDTLLVWWDADAMLTAPLTEQKLKTGLGPFDWVAASLGRKDWDHTETGFMAFNLQHEGGLSFIKDMVHIYESEQIFKLQHGRTDSFVYDVVKDIYEKQRGGKFKNISEGISGTHVWPNTFLAKFSEHHKGPEAKSNLQAQITGHPAPQPQQSVANAPRDRYSQIYKLMEFTKPSIITEIGLARGDRAESMIRQAFKTSDHVVYFGFDLFEDLDPETAKKEMNGKAVDSQAKIAERLKKIEKDHPNFWFQLYKGNTNETLKRFVEKPIELTNSNGLVVEKAPSDSQIVFIDGGHSVETIKNDYSYFTNIPLILLDDYYVPGPDGRVPDTSKWGCNFLEKEVKNPRILPAADPVKEGGYVKIMACGELAGRIEIQQAPQQGTAPQSNQSQSKPEQSTVTQMQNTGGKGVKIETRNSVEHDVIQAQVRHVCEMMNKYGIPNIPKCNLHNKWAYLVGGASSYKKPQRVELLREGAKDPNSVVFTSKTAHDFLLSKDIVPWGCLLLDPRPHVIDAFGEPHPDITYFVASQCHQSVIDTLIEKGAKIVVYHAEVAAGERDIVKELRPNDVLTAGGSTSQSRGMSVLMTMGFYRFKLFGLDSSYPSKPEKVHGINQEKKAMEITVNSKITGDQIGGGKYWVDPELLAQINDLEHITKIFSYLELDNHSDGLMEAMLKYWLRPKDNIEEVLNDLGNWNNA